MKFLYLEYLWLLLLLLPLFLKVNLKELRVTSYGYIFSFLFVVLALCRPVIEQEPLKSEQLLSDVILGVDLSYSMHASDLEPTRLEFAKEMLEKVVDSGQKSRFGVLGFYHKCGRPLSSHGR